MKVYLLSGKGYVVWKIHKTMYESISSHFLFQIGGLFRLWELYEKKNLSYNSLPEKSFRLKVNWICTRLKRIQMNISEIVGNINQVSVFYNHFFTRVFSLILFCINIFYNWSTNSRYVVQYSECLSKTPFLLWNSNN